MPVSLLQCMRNAPTKRKAAAIADKPWTDPDQSKRGSLNGPHADTACEAASPQAAAVSAKKVLTVSQSSLANDRQEQQLPARPRVRLAPSSFYGSERLRLIDERLARLFASAYRCSEGSTSVPFEQFQLQQQAFIYADTHELAEQLSIFAVEFNQRGSRSFVVSTHEAFWKRYQAMLPQHRHYYEIIREGEPCHLYFDLEFNRILNRDLDGQHLTDTLLDLVQQHLKAAFDVDMKACQVIELDSCAEEKFSRHLIIRLPGLAFCTNAHMGAFVRRVVAGLPQGPATGDCSAVIGPAAGQLGITQSTLQPATGSGRWTNPAGTAQAKHDKETAPNSTEASQQSSELTAAEPMLPLPGKGCGVLQAEDEQDDAEALELVAAVESESVSAAHCRGKACDERLLVLKDAGGAKTSFADLGVYTRNRAFRLFLSSKACKQTILVPTERYFHNQGRSHRETFMASLICRTEPGCQLLTYLPDGEGQAMQQLVHISRVQRCSGSGCALPAPSPCPALDSYIASMCCEGGVQGQVRSWISWPDIAVLLLNIKGNRWCGNVGRAHKSNGIFVMVDLQAEVWRQRCYDEECSTYQSPAVPVPAEVLRCVPDSLKAALYPAMPRDSPVGTSNNWCSGVFDRSCQAETTSNEAAFDGSDLSSHLADE